MAITIEKEGLEKRLFELCETEPEYIIELFKITKNKLEQNRQFKFDENMMKIFEKYENVFKSLA
jgi:hypothetical protein